MNPTFFRQPSRSLVARLVAGTLIPALGLVSVPVEAAPRARAAQQAAPLVKVNRTIPKVGSVRLRPMLSDEPSDQELFKARIFEEPFVPVGGSTTPDDNGRLGQAVQAFVKAGDRLDLGPFERFLSDNHASPWRASVLVGMGGAYLHAGRFTRAARCWQEAWNLSKNEEDPRSRAVADRALGELANLRARFGQVTEAELLLKEAGGRRMRGSAIEKLNAAGAQLVARTQHPDLIHPTGALSLASILANRAKGAYKPDARLEDYRAPQYGSTLAQIEELARDVGLNLRMAYHADKDAPIEVPSVAHLSMGHYAAVVARNQAGTRYLLEDAAYGQPLWVSREALLEEASGYFLIEGEDLPDGWRSVGRADGDRILGRCLRSGHPNNTTPQDDKEGDCGCSENGMATYRFHALAVSLNITDTPLGYSPPRGPAVSFDVTYNHKEAGQPSIFSYSNLGPRWTFGQLSFIEDESPEALVLHVRGGGLETYTGFDGQSTEHHYKSQNQLVRVSTDPVVWEVRHSDGSADIYSQPDCEICTGRRVFLTRSEDSAGNAVALAYDEDLRLVAITDAVGQVTTLSHDLPADPFKITRVTDPFGRAAQFEYDGAGNLVRITDVLGLSSEFRYDSTETLRADFITALTTPHGTTTFRQTETSYGYTSTLDATDPLGGTERIAYDANDNLVPEEQRHPAQDDPATVPFGFTEYNVALNSGLTHYWSKRAMAVSAGDYRKAKVIRWLTDAFAGAFYTSGVKQSEKLPLQNRVWYAYQGVTTISTHDGRLRRGPSGLPTKVGRVLDDGASQVQAYEYGSKGHKIRSTDASGRTTSYVYAANEVDLIEVRVVNGQSLERLARYTYNDQHQPLTATDAAGQTTTYTYTANGQIATVVTPARDGLSAAERTTTYEYYPSSDPTAPDRLKRVTGPSTAQGAATTTYTYDAVGRMRTTTDSDGYTVTQDYDALDRPTRTMYPDGTYEETIYERLDAVRHRDRLGRRSHTFYDALRRVIGTNDAAGRTTRLEYSGGGCVSCAGGNDLTGLVDANGNTTRWEYDDRGRKTKEIRANGAEYHYTYDSATGRLKTITDPKGNVKTNVFNRDKTLAGITYSVAGGTSPTPNVSFTYDPIHNRVTSMTDGTGTTTYSYYPVTSPPTLGAGRLKSIDGPLNSDTIDYSYDELGRVTLRQIGTSANTQTQHFDSQGRLTTLTSPLGTFTYAYDGVSGRPTTLTYPNGQTTTWAYYDNLGDHRLQEIHNKRPGGATLSRFTYTYDEAGNILTWSQQADSDPAKVYDLGYDKTDQLTAAILKSTDPTPQILKRYYYAYDPAGNRTAEQIDDAVTGASYNNINQLVSQQAGGALVFKGTVSEPAAVTVGGKPGTVTADNRFEGQAVVPSGTGQVAVTATDPSGNVRTSTYQVSQGATSKAFAYDLNGNMTSDGTRTYEWDAENRLVAVKEGANTIAGYTYRSDGLRTSKTVGGVTTSYVIDGAGVVEERHSTGGNKTHFQGVVIDRPLATRDEASAVAYYSRDHLGSVRETTDSLGTVLVRRDYDPWGSALAGAANAGWSFTGREWEPEINLYYFRNRYYAPSTARFLSEDPVGARDSSLYTYVLGRPTTLTDPYGTKECLPTDECRSGTWSFVTGEVSLPKVAFIKSHFTLTATATCYGVWNVVPQTVKAEVSISCKAVGAVAEVGSAVTTFSGGFSNACCREELNGDYRGPNVGARFASASRLWKQGGEQVMDLGVPLSFGGLGVHVSYLKCTVSPAGEGGDK